MKLSLPFSILLTTLNANIINACPFSKASGSETPPDDANHKNLRRRRVLASLSEDEGIRSTIADLAAKRQKRHLQNSACVSTSVYDTIHDDVVDIANAIVNADGSPNQRERGHFFGGIVRLAAHDFMDFDRNAPNDSLGPDGCLDFTHTANGKSKLYGVRTIFMSRLVFIDLLWLPFSM